MKQTDSPARASEFSSPPLKRFLTRAEVANELEISLSTVERLINRGKLPAFKVGDHWRVQRRDLDAFIEARLAEQRRQTGAAE